MSVRAEVFVKKFHSFQHQLRSWLGCSGRFSRNFVPLLTLMAACIWFTSQTAYAVMQKTVVDNYEFTWVSHEDGQYDWDDVISFDEVLEIPELANSPTYLMSVPFDYTAFRRFPTYNNDLAYLERVGEPPDEEWHMTSHRYLDDYVPTLDTWIGIIRSEDHLDIAPAVPVGLLTNVTKVPEPAAFLLAILSLAAMPFRLRHR
ncbi:MAG: hypothetical protein MK161_12490 [Pirellulales bacterium]|nr:hypothetical protein [Pirellulales bacterium]